MRKIFFVIFCRSDAQRAAKQKEAKERELEQVAFSADRIEEGGFPLSMVRKKRVVANSHSVPTLNLQLVCVYHNRQEKWCTLPYEEKIVMKVKTSTIVSGYIGKS